MIINQWAQSQVSLCILSLSPLLDGGGRVTGGSGGAGGGVEPGPRRAKKVVAFSLPLCTVLLFAIC